MYQPYTVVPVNGATMQLGVAPPSPVQPDDQRFCTLADAQVILKVFLDAGVADARLLDASTATINGEHFFGVDPNSPARPYYITSSTVTGPVGPALWIQYGPNNVNGGGRGNPGAWVGVLTGNPRWVPTSAPTQISTPSTPINSSGDAAALANALGAPGAVFTQADRDAINNTERLVIEIANAINLK